MKSRASRTNARTTPASTYDLELLPADFIAYVKRIQAHAGHETQAQRLARALQIRVRAGAFNYTLPDAVPDPLIVVEPWFYGWSNDVLRHELAHVLLYWSGLESHIIAHYGPEDGWRVVERLCQQAIAFLHIPQPVLNDAVKRYGVSAQAVLHLQHTCRASTGTALRRLIYDNPHDQRAGFITSGPYIAEIACCNATLPFSWLERVPEPQHHFPEPHALTLARTGRTSSVGVLHGT